MVISHRWPVFTQTCVAQITAKQDLGRLQFMVLQQKCLDNVIALYQPEVEEGTFGHQERLFLQ